MTIQKIQKVTVKGIVYNDRKIFMLRDQGGKWELPGGRIGFGEHPKQALQREFKEELGVDVKKIGDLIDVWDFTVTVKKEEYHFILIIYECSADLSKIKISNEHLEYRWVPLDKINGLKIREGYKNTIEKYRELKNIF